MFTMAPVIPAPARRVARTTRAWWTLGHVNPSADASPRAWMWWSQSVLLMGKLTETDVPWIR